MLLRAFVCPYKVDGASLYKSLQDYLPPYMVPTIYVVEQLPLNVSDKVDHRLVAAAQDSLIKDTLHAQQSAGTYKSTTECIPFPKPAVTTTHHITSHTIQETVSKTWMSVLDQDKIPPPDANFFDLGGNRFILYSLMCFRLVLICVVVFLFTAFLRSYEINFQILVSPLLIYSTHLPSTTRLL